MQQKKSKLAQQLGRRGGNARAKRLSARQRQTIAARGGHARAASLRDARRIAENFRYVEAMDALQRKPVVQAVRRCPGRLPSVASS